MEKNTLLKSNDKLSAVLKSLLCSYLLTGVLLLGLAFLLYQFHLKENQINIGITVIYVLSTLLGGFLCGKTLKVRKFMWGLGMGVLYFLFLIGISLGVYRELQQSTASFLLTLVLCAGGGMIGGMIS